jgi:hypothetical protein
MGGANGGPSAVTATSVARTKSRTPGAHLDNAAIFPRRCPSKKRGWLATDSSPVRSVKNPRNNFRVASLPWIGHDPAVVSPQDGTSPRSAILPSPEAARSPNAGAPGRICGASRTELTPTLGRLTPRWARGMPRRPSVVVTTLSVELEAHRDSARSCTSSPSPPPRSDVGIITMISRYFLMEAASFCGWVAAHAACASLPRRAAGEIQ